MATGREWPVDLPIRHLGVPGTTEGALAICLSGENAAAAFSLVRDGEDHENILVTDGGEAWTIQFTKGFPSIEVFDHRCAPPIIVDTDLANLDTTLIQTLIEQSKASATETQD